MVLLDREKVNILLQWVAFVIVHTIGLEIIVVVATVLYAYMHRTHNH